MFLLTIFIYLTYVFGSTCRPYKALGANCFRDKECATNFCKNSKCEKLPGYGELCTKDQRCADGFGCSARTNGHCEPISKHGEVCQYSKAGQDFCDKGLLCYNKVCQRAKGLYSECADDGKCKENQICRFDIRKLKNICTHKNDVGQVCITSDSCLDGAYCDKKIFGIGTCHHKKLYMQNCRKNNCVGDMDCVENLGQFRFVSKSRICQSLPGKGVDCGSKCSPGLYCGLE